MKRPIVRLFLVLLFISAASASGPSQEIFDALRKGDAQTARALVKKTPALVDARDAQGLTLLHHAAYGSDTGLIGFLIDKGAKLELQNAEGKTPLHIAAMNDRREAVEALVKRGAALEARDDYQRTPLILCARERGQAATGRVLIEAGADIDAADKFGSTSLELAAWRGKKEFTELLLEKGAKLPAPGDIWREMVLQSASHGLEVLFSRLTEGIKDLKDADPSGTALLPAAAAGGSAEIVRTLLEKGLDPARPDGFGWTALHYAALDGRVGAAGILIGKGAPIDARTKMGQTPFNVAKERGMEGVAALLAEKGADKADIRFPVLEGDYLGQKPPGEAAELFGPGIISSIWGLHGGAVFSPAGDEVCWSPMIMYPGEIYSRGGVLMMKRSGGRWTAPGWAPFSGPANGDDVPFFSADGNHVYFLSRRRLPGEAQGEAERIWLADRKPGGGWTEPRAIDPVVNTHSMHWAFSLDFRGDLYFGGGGPDSLGMGDIYLARFVGGGYEKPVNLGAPISSALEETTPFIAPDGSYLLFSRRFDLWVSFRAPDGTWGEPLKLGPEVNTPAIELCPTVTADGKFLFFLSQRGGESHAYWVSARVVEKLRPGRPQPIR